MNTVSLAWRLLRGGGRRGMLGSVLTLAAVTLATGLLLFAVAGNHAFAERGDRTSWRIPVKATHGVTAIEAVSQDKAHNTTFTRVDLAATGSGEAPVPPGMRHFPRPGEVWVSPAMKSLMDDLPRGQLADRFGARPSGVLGDAALVNSADKVVVVGHSPKDKAMTAPRYNENIAPTPISSFDSPAIADTYAVYRGLMVLATILMVVPLLVFGGAAARLTVARRDQRLASLRLVGATPGQVVGVTVAEAVITALIGAVAGTVVYVTAMPALARISIDGAGWYVGDLWPGAAWVGLVLVAVPILVGLSAVVGLRRVVVSPLGVARRHTPPAVRAIRLVVLAALMLAFLIVASGMFPLPDFVAVTLILFLLTATFLAVNFVGPWVVSIIGRITAGVSRKASTMLAGRRLVDDPRAAWRTVAGVALTGFVAGFICLLAPNAMHAADDGPRTSMNVTVPASAVPALRSEAVKVLGDGTTVRDSPNEDKSRWVEIRTSSGVADIDTLRTRLIDTMPGAVVTTTQDGDAEGERTFGDIRTGVLVVMSVSLLIAMVSAAISGASGVLDRRQTYALLHLSGTPIKTLNAARRTETLIPLAVMGGGSLLIGAVMAAPFHYPGADIRLTGVWILLATVGLGLLGILGAGALSRPLLRSVMVNAAPRPD
ncbi:MAG TPA: FtsX-like permease family protein [Stackebrandtia sp.]|jgi:hypothetical protein|uniref:FtsX-like permease family protein n=1 Tax=Stackebrandtia sp. TaxID=2023065 RepID=UPI002D2AAB11|nr:FtsX-like permease family protein [Stackebrandtia sp.]HZE38345.1 FtsX-like permease family protein [Stackebrandtia sp.]